MFNVPAQVAVQAVSHHQEVASATALYLTSLPLGGAVGSAIASAIWNNKLGHYLNKYAPGLTAEEQNLVINSYFTAVDKFPWGTVERDGIAQAYSDTLKILCIVGLVISALGIPFVLYMEDFKLVDKRSVIEKVDEEDGQQQQH